MSNGAKSHLPWLIFGIVILFAVYSIRDWNQSLAEALNY